MKKPINLRIAVLLLFVAARSAAQTCDFFVGGYIPSWRNPATVDYTKLSHTFYAFATTDHTGELILDDDDAFILYKTATAGKQRFLSLGGAGNTAFSSMAASGSALQNFASNCVTFCQANNIQGIDVDWEGIITAEDSAKYGDLMRALATELHAHDLKLTATLSYGSYGGDFYNLGALNVADWIQLMVYDQTATWADSPYGNHSTYQHMLDALNYWAARGFTDHSKIVIGLPFYGYRFNNFQGGFGTALTYSDITFAYPYLSCDQDEVSLTFFNSPETIRQKTLYVKSHGLKGVMIWEMSQDLVSTDNRSLLKAISLAACDEPAACNTFFTVGLPAKAAGEEILVAPNPVDRILNISLVNSQDRISKFDLMDNLGRVLLSRKDSFPETVEAINVSNLSPGIYFLRITLPSGRVALRRVVKL